MDVKNYLEKHQKIIYQTFFNSLSNHSLSHAYLLCGNTGTPLYEVAVFLAKSILCDEPNPFACENCITCSRIDGGNYPDFLIFDGSKETIKKSQVDEIETAFEKKAFESKGIKVYILHLIENMTTQAINAILKFLEEPGKEIYAFLTTNNEALILPTIVSRCQTMHLKLIDRNTIIDESIDLGVEPIDAQLLSYFYNDAELLKQHVEDDDYQAAKEALIDLLTDLNNDDKNKSIYTMQRTVSNLITSKGSASFFLDMLAMSFEDIHALKNNLPGQLAEIDEIISPLCVKLKNIDESIIEILKAKSSLSLNLNIPLVLDHLILKINEKEENIHE
jgi:DNA polymerase-3 subunit delta'